MGVDTKNIQVGDRAFGSFGQYGAVKVLAGRVTKVTATGHVTVDFGEVFPGNGEHRVRRFTNAGWEIGGGDRWASGGRLIDEATFIRLADKQQAQGAKRAVIDLLRSWSFKNKAELNALVAKLTALAALVPDDESTAQSAGADAPTPSQRGQS